MLIERHLPKVLWGTAALHAAYLRNRAFTTALRTITPYERWTQHKPNVSSLQEFGLPVSILHEGPSDKLDPKGNIHVFVGFEDGPRAIRYFDIKTKQVKITRNYHFLLNCEHPPRFEGETLGENESLWDLSGEAHDVDERRDPPLTIHIPKRPIANVVEEDDEDDVRPRKRQKSIYPYTNPQVSFHAEMIYTAFNQSGIAPVNPMTLQEAQDSDEWPEWEKAIATELEQLRDMGTWDLVDLPDERRPVGNKWVFLKKFTKTGILQKYKARLVAKGYSQIPGMDFSQTFSPVVRLETIRMILALAVNMDWEMTQMDVKGAYLNGNLEEEVYMKQPEGYGDGTDKVCQLIKTLYGLKQAGREWNKKLDASLKGQGFHSLLADPCVYIRETEDHLEIITVWVDDLLLFADTSDIMDNLKKEIQTLYEVSDLRSPQKIVGIEIDHNCTEG